MHEHKYFGFYRAKVVNNNDPQKYGQVQVWIPAIMTDESLKVWALPANNILGGIDPTEESSHRQGSCIIPYIGSWVWVFFEGGDLSKPFYFTTVNIELVNVIAENQVGDPAKKYTLIRTRQGRVIILSDDDVDARTEITGKKRLSDNTVAGNTDNIYTIENNQSTVLIDDRVGKEKILIEDFHGNGINIKTTSNEIHIYGKTNVIIKADGSIYVQGETVNVKGNTVNIEADNSVNIKAGQQISMDAPQLNEQCGSAGSADSKDVDLNRG